LGDEIHAYHYSIHIKERSRSRFPSPSEAVS
jgi:hypothetical protein